MKVIATENFFTSFKNCFGIRGKINKIRSWFHYHFTKGYWKLFKTVLQSYPFDYSYLLELEKVKIIEMADYIEKAARYEGYEKDVKYMRIAAKLIDIITEQVNLFHYNGKLEFIPLENNKYEVNTNNLEYVCHVNVNTRNINRFFNKEEPIEYYKIHKHELYIRKARYLYHKIRYYEEEKWWN